MTWLEANWPNSMPPGLRLADRLKSGKILRTPGAHNGLAGLAAKKAGFETLYISGAGVSASMGLPDLGVMTLEDLCFSVRTIFRATDLPVIVDADTGYGEALNVMRTVRELEMAGAAAIQIEDQKMPKKCGHLNNKQLIDPEEMSLKIAAAISARSHARIIARTDAFASEGLDSAIKRAQQYVNAGADIVFADGLAEKIDFETFSSKVNAPALANMTEFGKTPYYTAEQFEEMGYRIIIWPVSQLRVALKAMEELYETIASEDGTKSQKHKMKTRSELYELIGYFNYEALDQSIIKSILPDLSE